MHVVYICSPDRRLQLLASLGSLLTSGTRFDHITIYLIGRPSKPWVFADDRIDVVEKPDIGNGFWMANKTHLTDAVGERVVFIDTDTFVLRPLDLLYEGVSGDIAGRVATSSRHSGWDRRAWKEHLDRHGAESFFPYLNTGLLAFSHGANRHLSPSWLEITTELRGMESSPFGNVRPANQHAFSLACGAAGLSHDLLSDSQHAYGWRREDHTGAIVYHSGNTRFFRVAVQLNRETGVLDDNPLIGRLDRAQVHCRGRMQKLGLHKLWRGLRRRRGHSGRPRPS